MQVGPVRSEREEETAGRVEVGLIGGPRPYIESRSSAGVRRSIGMAALKLGPWPGVVSLSVTSWSTNWPKKTRPSTMFSRKRRVVRVLDHRPGECLAGGRAASPGAYAGEYRISRLEGCRPASGLPLNGRSAGRDQQTTTSEACPPTFPPTTGPIVQQVRSLSLLRRST